VSGLVLEDVALQQGPITAVRIGRLVVHYSVTQVARGNAIAIDRLDVTGLRLTVVHLPSGGLNLGSLIKKRAPSGRPRRTIDIREIQLNDAELTFDRAWGPSWMRLPLRISRLTSTLGLLSREGLLSFPIKALSADAFDPAFSVRNFAGEVAIEPDGWRIRQGVLKSGESSLLVSSSFKSSGYDVTADAATFSFPEMARLVPGLKSIEVPARVQVTMRGAQAAVQTHLVASSPAGGERPRRTYAVRYFTVAAQRRDFRSDRGREFRFAPRPRPALSARAFLFLGTSSRLCRLRGAKLFDERHARGRSRARRSRGGGGVRIAISSSRLD
jgi:hypothetical protein